MTPADRLAEMDSLLAQIASTPTQDHRAEIAPFLAHCFALDTLLRGAPSGADAAQIATFLQSSAPTVAALAIPFDSGGGEALRIWMQQEITGPDWIRLCLRRSHIEAFNTLYAPHVAATDLIDTEELDTDIRDKAELEAQPDPAQAPPNLPDSHWWWHLG